MAVNNKLNHNEIESYQKLLEDYETRVDLDNNGILMLIPVNEKISVAESTKGLVLKIAI